VRIRRIVLLLDYDTHTPRDLPTRGAIAGPAGTPPKEVDMSARNLRDRLFLGGTLLVLIAGLVGTAAAETPLFDAALQRAAEENKPLILDFYTDW
jgi:hypothetical protein